MDISPLEYKTNMMPQSVGANQVVIKWHILKEQRPHVLCEFASFTGYGENEYQEHFLVVKAAGV